MLQGSNSVGPLSFSLGKFPKGSGSDALDYEGMVIELLGSVDVVTGDYTFEGKVERRGENDAFAARWQHSRIAIFMNQFLHPFLFASCFVNQILLYNDQL